MQPFTTTHPGERGITSPRRRGWILTHLTIGALAVAGCNLILGNEAGELVPGSGSGGEGGDASGTGGGGGMGGGGGGNSDGPLEVTVSALPLADFNIDYSAALEVSGDGPYEFELLDGAPEGLSSNAAGVVSGRPLEAGEFELSVRITSGGRSTDALVPLTVRRKPWFAFRVQSGLAGPGRHMVYLKHLFRSTAPTRVLSSVSLHTTVGRFAFSPDGSLLSFLADNDTEGLDELYLIDTSTETLGTAEKVTTDLDIHELAWSPSGADLALVAWDGAAYDLLRLDVTQSPPELVPIAEDIGSVISTSLHWVSDDYLVYLQTSQVHAYQRLTNGDFVDLGPLTLDGTLGSVGPLSVDTEAERLFVARSYMSGSWEIIVDFTDESLPFAQVNGRMDVTRDYTLAVRSGNPPTVVDLADNQAVVATLAGGIWVGAFAKSRRELYWADTSRVRIQAFDGLELDGDPVSVPGTYAPAIINANRGLLALTANDEWVAFAGDRVMYASRVGDGEPEAAVVVSPEFVEGATGVNGLFMAPTSRTLVYAADQDEVDQRELYYVDLEGDEPTLGRNLMGFSGSQRYPSVGFPAVPPTFSRDSAFLAFPYEQGDLYCPEIHIVNLLDDEARSVNPLVNYSPIKSADSCTDVSNVMSVATGMNTAYLFQP